MHRPVSPRVPAARVRSAAKVALAVDEVAREVPGAPSAGRASREFRATTRWLK
jgi:hypothetical protein